MYVVTVSFQLKPAHRSDFLREMLQNARTSAEVEPGCRQFDVCVDPADDSQVFLYELYDDRAAFEAHLASPHFLAFDRLTAGWTAAKSVRTLVRL